MDLRALQIVKTLSSHGHVAYYAGGCVRDMLLGLEPHDIDIVTDATPNKVESIFSKTIPVGKQFGIIVVLIDGQEYEVATFRNDGNYIDGRRPKSISFSSPKEDAQRRDLTINGLFYDPLNDKIMDFVGGKQDIENKVIRFIGNAQDRIDEDRLRILRAVRFAAKLDFSMDEDTKNIIRKNAHRIHDVSIERIKDELDKMLISDKPSIAFEMLRSLGLLDQILPEVSTLWNCEQSAKWHSEGNCGIHTMMVLDATRERTNDLNLLWAALLHDVGKPATSVVNADGNISCHNHDKVGADIALSIMERMKSSNFDKEMITSLVAYHMQIGTMQDMRKATVRKFIAQPHFDKLITLFEADCLSCHPADSERAHTKMDGVTFVKSLADKMKNEKQLPKPILTGKHLIDLGMKPGPKFKEILGFVMDKQLEGEVHTIDECLTIVRNYE